MPDSHCSCNKDVLVVLEEKGGAGMICKLYPKWPLPALGSPFDVLPHTAQPTLEIRKVHHRPQLDLVELRFDPLDSVFFDGILASAQGYERYSVFVSRKR